MEEKAMNYSKIRSMQGFWILGKIINHLAIPLDGDEIDVVVEQLMASADKNARIKELEEREIKRLDAQAKENMRLDNIIAAKETRIKELEKSKCDYCNTPFEMVGVGHEPTCLVVRAERAERELSEARDACNGLHDMVKGYEADLRSIAGALGEFYGRDAVPLVEKIRALRKERDEGRGVNDTLADEVVRVEERYKKRLSRLILHQHRREIASLSSYLKNYWHTGEITEYDKELLEKYGSPFHAYQEGRISLGKLTELIALAVYELGWRHYPTIVAGITAADKTEKETK